MRSEEIRKEALSVYSHANVRDRYDADLMMAGFSDGAEWADAHPVSTEPQAEPSDVQVVAASAEFERVWNAGIETFEALHGDADTYIQTAMRAALRAASSVGKNR